MNKNIEEYVKEKLRKFKPNENIDDYENVIPIYDNETYLEERNEIFEMVNIYLIFLIYMIKCF